VAGFVLNCGIRSMLYACSMLVVSPWEMSYSDTQTVSQSGTGPPLNGKLARQLVGFFLLSFGRHFMSATKLSFSSWGTPGAGCH